MPVVLHAPSHRGVKGIRFLVEAISQLRKEGIPLEFTLVEGLSHATARSIYQRADLLVDQLLVAWYGGLAVGLMALGKPVICYVREDDLKFIPPSMRQNLPVIGATPASICDVLRESLTSRRRELPEIERLSRSYVEKWHDPLKVARQTKALYECLMSKHSRR